MDNGVSKKVCITAASILAITQLAQDAPDKIPYAIVVGVICVVYKLVQGWIDYKKKG
jgi:hypothetical protein